MPDKPIVVTAIISSGTSLGPMSVSRSMPRSPLVAQANPANTAPASMPADPPLRLAWSNRIAGRGARATQHVIAPAMAPAAVTP